MATYYVYSQHTSYDAAEEALEDYFANGEVCEAEKPYISRRSRNYSRKIDYCVMFPG